MEFSNWLHKQKQIYPNQTLPPTEAAESCHPIHGTWQPNSPYLKTAYWWGGGASQAARQQIEHHWQEDLTQVAVLTFGPVQTFLGGGQKLRDWAIASWLCHYLTGAVIYRWEQELKGKVLLPLTHNSDLLKWLDPKANQNINWEKFWRASLPNVITGLLPASATENWQAKANEIVQQEWEKFILRLETAVVTHDKCKKLINGVGWKVIKRDCQYLWSVYSDCQTLELENITEIIAQLHRNMEAQKQGRRWRGTWWAGRTSPSDGHLSIWHPGLQPIDGYQNVRPVDSNQEKYKNLGTWGMPEEELNRWWEKIVLKSNSERRSLFSNMFSSGDRLNSMELVRRISSFPEIITNTLELLWEKKTHHCPWGRFPDNTAAAAAWIVKEVDSTTWNNHVAAWQQKFKFFKNTNWGIEQVDNHGYAHPRVLERRNFRDRLRGILQENKKPEQQPEEIKKREKQLKKQEQEQLKKWRAAIPDYWDCTIEWTVGWRGDGDDIGDWISGQQYQKLNLPWSKWHPPSENQVQLDLQPQVDLTQTRQLDLPHILDLLVLFDLWNELLTQLTEQVHYSKVIFAGGDDFLLLGSIADAISLTNNLHRLWTGAETPLTEPTDSQGWVTLKSNQEIYPVPGQLINFSLGVVISQRRVPQSLWHRGLEQAYKEAKQQGKNRVCLKVLFNSGQSFTWICPWSLWDLLMSAQPNTSNKSALNRWEKLLSYLEQVHIEDSPATIGKFLDTLWQSVGIGQSDGTPLTWATVKEKAALDGRQEIIDWQWWQDWVSIRGFLARQELQRQKWQTRVTQQQEVAS